MRMTQSRTAAKLLVQRHDSTNNKAGLGVRVSVLVRCFSRFLGHCDDDDDDDDGDDGDDDDDGESECESDGDADHDDDNDDNNVVNEDGHEKDEGKDAYGGEDDKPIPALQPPTRGIEPGLAGGITLKASRNSTILVPAYSLLK